MTDDCIFCSIVASDVPARTVYETGAVSAFLNANPLAPGHTLVIPKSHAAPIEALEADLTAAVSEAVADL